MAFKKQNTVFFSIKLQVNLSWNPAVYDYLRKSIIYIDSLENVIIYLPKFNF